MDRPVAALFAVFAGPIDRVDDPDPRVGESFEVVLLLLGEQPIVRALFADRVDQELVGGLVAGLAQRLGREQPASRTSSSSRPAVSARCAARSASVIAASIT
jgi:hypothetical protein